VKLLRRLEPLKKKVLDKVFPDHWSFLLGEVAMYSMIVLFGTGIVLAFFYDASGERMVYSGAYEPLQGVEMSRAYASVLDISFEVRAGVLLRQTHHWSALVFTAAIALHATRIFFTGAYRRPRRANYLIGLTMLLLALATGFFGISLTDDLLSGTGARIAHAFALSVPFVGPGLADLLVGGEFPSPQMVNRFWWLHVLIIPPTLLALFSAHMALVWRQTHTQHAGGRRREDNVVGDALWPAYLLKSVALFAVVAGVLFALGGMLQIAPVWLYGPFDPASATVPAQPDWYLMFVEGTLRILPALDIGIGSYEVPSHFVAGVLLPLSIFAFAYAWPFLDERVRRDRDVHHLLERPRDHPVRTAIGTAGLALLAVLTVAANHDYLGNLLGISVDTMTRYFRIAALLVPPAAGALAWRIARDLQQMEEPPEVTLSVTTEPDWRDPAGPPGEATQPTVERVR
jgi:ubiquinol-cytochrome c reductase cytochrome b subunit